MTQSEIDQHLEMGKKLLAIGQLADALTEFHLVIGNKSINFVRNENSSPRHSLFANR
jgi:hypothetical protein